MCEGTGKNLLTDDVGISIGLQPKYLLSRNAGADFHTLVLSSGEGYERRTAFLPMY